LLPGGDVRGAKVWCGTPSPVLIHELLLNLLGFVTTPILAMTERGHERCSSSSASLTASSFGSRSWRSSSEGFLPLSSLEEAMMLLELRTTPDRNSSKRKHDENTIYKPRVIRGVI
jgi:hypothetical protein